MADTKLSPAMFAELRLGARREDEDTIWNVAEVRELLLDEVERLRAVEAKRDALVGRTHELDKRIAGQRRQLDVQQSALARKNTELDALHFVWCSGGCENGVHRFEHGELTPEIVREATRNTARLATRYIARAARLEPDHAAAPEAAVARVQARLFAESEFAPLREREEMPPDCDAVRYRDALRALVGSIRCSYIVDHEADDGTTSLRRCDQPATILGACEPAGDVVCERHKCRHRSCRKADWADPLKAARALLAEKEPTP